VRKTGGVDEETEVRVGDEHGQSLRWGRWKER
jgi:hypothetical protein